MISSGNEIRNALKGANVMQSSLVEIWCTIVAVRVQESTIEYSQSVLCNILKANDAKRYVMHFRSDAHRRARPSAAHCDIISGVHFS